MSLWTPDGEVPVDRSRQAAAGGGGVDDEAVASAAEALGIDPATLSPEDRERLVAMVAQMAEAQRRLAAADAADVVANHAMGLYELAAIHLTSSPPNLDHAALSIDALACLVEGLGERLGSDHSVLADALANIRLAFVQIKG